MHKLIKLNATKVYVPLVSLVFLKRSLVFSVIFPFYCFPFYSIVSRSAWLSLNQICGAWVRACAMLYSLLYPNPGCCLPALGGHVYLLVFLLPRGKIIEVLISSISERDLEFPCRSCGEDFELNTGGPWVRSLVREKDPGCH